MAVEHDWRKSLISAIGLVLGFSLGFLGNWSLSEGSWALIHLPALILLVAGNGILIVSLYRLTMPKFRKRGESGHETTFFTVGASLVLIGFLASVIAAWVHGH